MRKYYIVVLLTLLFVFATGAVKAKESVPPAQELILTTTDTILKRLKSEQEVLIQNPGKIYDLVDEMVLPHFDFDRISRWVLGRYWKKANATQRAGFSVEFKQLLVRTYAKALLEYTDQKVVFLPYEHAADAKDVTVKSEIDQPGGFAIPIHYSLHFKNNVWKVYDVEIDGVSLVANYRTSFAREIRKNGLNKLIVKLADRNVRAASE